MIEVVVPGTLSNLGAGFDVVGLAVGLHNTVRLTPLPLGQWRADGREVAPSDHLVLATALAAGEAFGVPLPHGLAVEQVEQVPRARGLGSSAIARVAGLLGWAQLTGAAPPLVDLLAFLVEAERHPDNVLPAMLGGCVFSTGERPLAWRRLVPPARLRVALAIPAVQVSTERARGVLPASYARADLVFNTRRLAFLLDGLRTGDPESLALGSGDRVHQPYRAPLIGPVDEALAAARAAGAASAFISGSGSTLAALIVDDAVSGQAVADALAAPFRVAGIEVQAVEVPVETRGAWRGATG
jgi:homoserine kinase